MKSRHLLIFLLLIAAVGCGGNESTTVQVAPAPVVTLTALSLSPTTANLAVSQTQQFRATATYSDGSNQDVTGSATWSTDAPATATVSTLGLATAVAPGSTQVSATLDGITGAATLNVAGNARVVVNHTFLPRALPGDTTTVRGTGFDEAGTAIYGPVDQPVAAVNTFTEVPILVTSLRLEYFRGSLLIGTFSLSVQLTENGTFTINDPDWQDAPPVATLLRFVKPPADSIPGQPLPAVRVQVVDQFGALFTGATEVTLALGANPSGGTLSGTLSRTTVDGTATFDDLSLDAAGAGYQLVANSPGLPVRVSTLFNVRTPADPIALAQKFLTYLYSAIPGVPVFVPPGYTVLWDIDLDMSLADGLDDTWDGALVLSVAGVVFPYDQTAAELTWFAPLITPAEGLLAPAVSDQRAAPSGVFSAFMPPARRTTLCQTVDLTASTAPITLAWTDDMHDLDNPTLFGELLDYRVVVRDPGGTLLATAFQSNTDLSLTTRTFNLDAFAGQTVQVCFEADNFTCDDVGVLQVDNVSVVDGGGTNRITNGDFETGDLTGWVSHVDDQSQNFRSGMRTVNGLQVTRAVYTRPDRPWIRYYDEFTNNTGAPMTTNLEYRTDLGSDGDGNSRLVPGTNGQAVSSSDVDSDEGDSDCGIVFGSGATLLAFTSYAGDIDFDYQNVTLNPGQTVAIVTFALQDGRRSEGVFNTFLEAQMLDIVQNFRRDPVYLDGLTAVEQSRILNL